MNEVERIGEEILKVVEAPVKFIDKAAKVLETAIKDQPALKATLTELVVEAEKIAAEVALDVSEKGLNFQQDAATLAAVEAFFAFIKGTVVPEIEAVFGQLKTDLAAS